MLPNWAVPDGSLYLHPCLCPYEIPMSVLQGAELDAPTSSVEGVFKEKRKVGQ